LILVQNLLKTVRIVIGLRKSSRAEGCVETSELRAVSSRFFILFPKITFP
jgi:hypothetical protein